MLKRASAAALIVFTAVAYVRADILEQVLVRVNGDIVTKTEFEQRQVAALRQRQDLTNISPDSPELKKAIAEITPELILSAVDELLLVQRGRELGWSMGDEQFAKIIEDIKKENKLDTDEKFQAALKQEGLSLSDLRRSLERQMLISRVQQSEVVGKIAVTEDESKAYYEKHKDQFTTPSAITLREILIEVPGSDKGVNVAQDDAAKEKILGIRHRLLGGEPFARLAADISDAPSKANGGLIGPINSTDIAPALRDMLRKMKPGDLTEPIRTARGYQLLKLESKTDETTRSYDEARDDISDQVAEEKRRGEMQRYVEKLRAQAIVSWKNEELKKAYDQAIADRKARLDTAMR